MPRHWEPLPHEVNLFHEIYIDETSQNDHHYLVIGGIVIPRKLAPQLEADIFAAKPNKYRGVNSKGEQREVGWKFVSNGDFKTYEAIVNAYFSFAYRRMQGAGHGLCRFYASIIDLTVKGRKYTGGERGRIGFERELYYHCLSIARRQKRWLFHVYPDFRTTSTPIRKLGVMMCQGFAKEGDPREWVFRRCQFRKSHEVQALQVSDLVIGAIAYYINGHYRAPNANRDKTSM